jgi:uncharacterized phiE125 gp8 family phage protein
MILSEVTEVPDAVLPLEPFKAHLRLGSGFDTVDLQEGLLVSFLRAALAAIEGRTGKALLRRDFTLSVQGWRDPARQVLPLAPVAALTRLVQVAGDGSEVEADPAGYWLEQDAQRPVLRARGGSLPAVPAEGQVRLHFEAGFGAGWGDLPRDLAQAVLMRAAHYYEFRHSAGLSGGCMPFGVSSLIDRHRALRLGFAP